MCAVVDPSYDGPRLEDDGAVTPAFLDVLIGKGGDQFAFILLTPIKFVHLTLAAVRSSPPTERFTEQKLLHSKYVIMILLASLKQFKSLPNIIEVKTKDAPVSRVGSTHTRLEKDTDGIELVACLRHLFLTGGSHHSLW